MRRILAIIRFISLFLYEFILANFNVAKIVLFVSEKKISPSFFNLNVSDMKKGEALFLGVLITLTPGTIAVDYDEKKKVLVVHALDFSEPQEVLLAIEKRLKSPLMEVLK